MCCSTLSVVRGITEANRICLAPASKKRTPQPGKILECSCPRRYWPSSLPSFAPLFQSCQSFLRVPALFASETLFGVNVAQWEILWKRAMSRHQRQKFTRECTPSLIYFVVISGWLFGYLVFALLFSRLFFCTGISFLTVFPWNPIEIVELEVENAVVSGHCLVPAISELFYDHGKASVDAGHRIIRRPLVLNFSVLSPRGFRQACRNSS